MPGASPAGDQRGPGSPAAGSCSGPGEPRWCPFRGQGSQLLSFLTRPSPARLPFQLGASVALWMVRPAASGSGARLHTGVLKITFLGECGGGKAKDAPGGGRCPDPDEGHLARMWSRIPGASSGLLHPCLPRRELVATPRPGRRRGFSRSVKGRAPEARLDVVHPGRFSPGPRCAHSIWRCRHRLQPPGAASGRMLRPRLRAAPVTSGGVQSRAPGALANRPRVTRSCARTVMGLGREGRVGAGLPCELREGGGVAGPAPRALPAPRRAAAKLGGKFEARGSEPASLYQPGAPPADQMRGWALGEKRSAPGHSRERQWLLSRQTGPTGYGLLRPVAPGGPPLIGPQGTRPRIVRPSRPVGAGTRAGGGRLRGPGSAAGGIRARTPLERGPRKRARGCSCSG